MFIIDRKAALCYRSKLQWTVKLSKWSSYIMKPRGTVTNKLADVLQVLQLARRTGKLEVERAGAGNVIEQGLITLHNGQIIDASFGPYKGGAALDILSKWGTCYFTFHVSTTSGSVAPLNTPLPRSPVTNGLRREPTTGPLAGPMPGTFYRIYAVEEALPQFSSKGLTRVHRQLFLLIDGQRAVPELARLIGRSSAEVEALLADLERTGFIRQP
jgi:hypothetical protein